MTYSFSFFSTIDASDLAIFRIPPSSCQTDGGPLPNTWEEWPFRITPEVASSFRTIFNPELRGAAIFLTSTFLSFSISGSVPEPTVQNVERVLPVFRCPTEFALHRVKEDLKIFFHRNICAKFLYAVTLDGRLCHNPCCYTIVGSFTSRGDWSCDICLLCVRWQVPIVHSFHIAKFDKFFAKSLMNVESQVFRRSKVLVSFSYTLWARKVTPTCLTPEPSRELASPYHRGVATRTVPTGSVPFRSAVTSWLSERLSAPCYSGTFGQKSFSILRPTGIE